MKARQEGNRIEPDRRKLAALAGFCLLCGSGCAHLPARHDAAKTSERKDDAYEQMEVLTDAMMHIRRSYLDPDKTTFEKLTENALRGMLRALDPYSHFLDAETFKHAQDETSGRYGGVGVTIGLKDSALVVYSPMDGSPAAKAGLKEGDRILEIDGRKTAGLSVEEAARQLRGEKGTKVALKIERPPEGQESLVQIVRDEIIVKSVSRKRIAGERIGYVHIKQFNKTTAEEMSGALEDLKKDGVSALVLDLRGTPGGLLDSAVDVCGQFLKPGEVVVHTVNRSGERTSLRSRVSRKWDSGPVAVLVDGRTASAAEIVVGALKDHKRAVVVGERTFGKDVVQAIVPLSGGSAIRMTTARYHTPDDQPIGHGIAPDIAVGVRTGESKPAQSAGPGDTAGRTGAEKPGKTEEAKAGEPPDIQLEHAVDVLKGIMLFRDRGADTRNNPRLSADGRCV